MPRWRDLQHQRRGCTAGSRILVQAIFGGFGVASSSAPAYHRLAPDRPASVIGPMVSQGHPARCGGSSSACGGATLLCGGAIARLRERAGLVVRDGNSSG